MNWKDKTVLVTGGGGFLGRYIVERLLNLECKKVKSIGRSSQPELEDAGVEVICGNISDVETVVDACKGCDIVIHTAAKAGVWGAYKDFYSVNVRGTENIISACLKNKVECLVNTSTPSVVCSEHDIVNGNEAIPYPETYPAYYPETKAKAERLVTEASEKNGLKTISIRPHLIWGVRDPHILPRILIRARKKRLMQIGDGKNIVDLTHVINAAEAHIKAAEAVINNPEISGRNYFISDDNPVNLWDWINEFLAKMGVEKISKSISFKKAYRIGSVMELIFRILRLKGEPPMTRFVAIQLSHSHYFDISAAKKDLGYKSIVNVDKELITTVEWLKSTNK